MEVDGLKKLRREAEEFCSTNLRECCDELIEWQNTALLRDGKVRQLAKLCSKYAGNYDGLRVAERMVQNQACEAISAPTAAERRSIEGPEFDSLIVRLLDADHGERYGLDNDYLAVRRELIAHIDTWAARSAAEAGPAVKYGCHCDLEPHMEPDGCVFDENRAEDCLYARRLKSRGVTNKEDCEYWQPIKFGGAAAQETAALLSAAPTEAETVVNVEPSERKEK